MKGLGGLQMKYRICLSIFIYKPWLVNEGGFDMRVTLPMNFFNTKITLTQTQAFLSGTYGTCVRNNIIFVDW